MSDVTESAAPAYPPKFDVEIVKALHWCRLGRVRPDDDGAFRRAEQLGLLAHHPTWHTTARGEGVLIALGLLNGAPAPPQTRVVVLWAACEHYPTPQFVAAWSEGLAECYPEGADDRRSEAEEWFKSFGEDECWRFWTTDEHLDRPPLSPDHGGQR